MSPCRDRRQPSSVADEISTNGRVLSSSRSATEAVRRLAASVVMATTMGSPHQRVVLPTRRSLASVPEAHD